MKLSEENKNRKPNRSCESWEECIATWRLTNKTKDFKVVSKHKVTEWEKKNGDKL